MSTRTEFELLAKQLFELRDELVQLSCSLHDLSFELAQSENGEKITRINEIYDQLSLLLSQRNVRDLGH